MKMNRKGQESERSKPRVLIAASMGSGSLNDAIAATYCEQGFLVRYDAGDVIEMCFDEEGFDAIVLVPYGPLPRPDVMESLLSGSLAGRRLRAVGYPNGNTSHLDPVRSLFEKHSIAIVNAPDMHCQAVAEYVLLQFGIHSRRLAYFNESTASEGAWLHREASRETRSLAGRTAGVIGTGRDGAAVIRLARAVGMQVVAINSGRSNGDQRIAALGARPAKSLAELLSMSDFLSITCRPSAETRGMIEADCFRQMKPDCVVVNTAGAELFDKGALINELRRRTAVGDRISIVLDLPYGGRRSDSSFVDDPDNLLLKELGVLFTPGMAGYTQESCLLGHRTVAAGLRHYLHEEVGAVQQIGAAIPKLDEVVFLARESANLALSLRDQGLSVTYKSDGSPTTNADLACEELIRRGLEDLGYVFDFVSEEEDGERGPNRHNMEVVIDAIDGTRNYRDGNYGWCCSIAVVAEGRTVLGIVHDAIANITYAAAEGAEPYCLHNGVRTPLLCPAKICADFSFSIGSFFIGGTSLAKAKMTEEIKKLGGRGREWGSVALSICAVARGGLGVFVQSNSYRHDHAAAVYIAQAAGACVSATRTIHFLKTDIVVCHPSLAKPVLAIFHKVMEAAVY